MTDTIDAAVNELIAKVRQLNGGGDNINQMNRSFVDNTLGQLIAERDRSSSVKNRVFSELRERGIELIDDTVDDGGNVVETAETDNEDGIITPFDTSAIDIETKSITVYSLVERLKYEEINLRTDFQRNFGLWDDAQKSRLIESLMLRIPLPAFYFDASNDESWLIIDGLQRLYSIYKFMGDSSDEEPLTLQGLEFLKQYNGCTSRQIPRALMRRINETNVTAYLLRPGTPSNVKYNIFKRLNTGGVELTSQEIRHAIYPIESSKLLESLAGDPVFGKATAQSVPSTRMLDQEFALRYVAVAYYGIEHLRYDSDRFLNDTMEWLSDPAHAAIREQIPQAFHDEVSCAYDIFGPYCFRKLGQDRRRRPVNKAVFEVWTRGLHQLTAEQRNLLVERADQVRSEFAQLCDSNTDECRQFTQALRSGDRSSYPRRFEFVDTLIRKVLEHA